jgi:hypothetical protein
VAGFAAAGSALLAGKSGTLRAVPLALEAAAGVTAAAFLASDFAPEVACCGALQMHEVLRGAFCDWRALCRLSAWLTVFCLLQTTDMTLHLQHSANQDVATESKVAFEMLLQAKTPWLAAMWCAMRR